MPINSTWKYYQHSLIPATPPNETPDLNELRHLMKDPKVFFARYTTDYDLPYQTEWYYCVKDTPFDINKLKSKRRYEIKSGCKNFYCEIINKIYDYCEDIFRVAITALADYPEYYKSELNKELFCNTLKQWEADVNVDFIICKKFENNIICGYAVIKRIKNCAIMSIVKTDPSYHKLQINAAIVKFIVDSYSSEYYICDGERPIRHQTNYQEYLCKYFDFRLVYCKLHIKYKLWLKIIITILFPFYDILSKISDRSSSKLLYNIISTLKQEKIRRTFL
jgi:hypothetical protein